MDERASRSDTNVVTPVASAHEIVGAGRDLPVRGGQSKREATPRDAVGPTVAEFGPVYA